MKLINNGTNPLSHGVHKLPKGAVADIPDDIAKDWLKIRGVKQFVSGADLTEATQKADKEKAALQDEITKLKAELADLKKVSPKEVEEKAEDTKKEVKKAK